MLTRLEVDGFKSLRDFAVDLEPFTVLIGPNSAGKSNIIEAIGLLSRLARMPPVEALQQGRGLIIDQFTRTGEAHVGEIRLAVELFEEHATELEPELRSEQTRFRAENTLTLREGDVVERTAQRLLGLAKEDDAWVQAHPHYAAWTAHGRAGELDLTSLSSLLPTHWRSRIELNELALLRDDLSTVQIHIHAPNLRLPSERLAPPRLTTDASNLPATLAALPPPLLGEVRAALSTVIPGVASFDILREGDMLSLEFTLSGGEKVPARIASDGTLRVLALLAAAYVPHGPKTICIEEPENGIYPRRLRDLLKILRERTRPREGAPLPPQIVVTTHSPIAIAALQQWPECIRFVDSVRRNSQRITRVRRLGAGDDRGRSAVSPQEIAELLDVGGAEDDV